MNPPPPPPPSGQLALWGQLIANTAGVGSFAQLAAYVGAIILGRWTVVISSVLQLHAKRLEIAVATTPMHTAKHKALVEILEETTQAFHFRLRLLRYSIFFDGVSVLLIIVSAFINGFSAFSSVPQKMARPLLVTSIVFLLVGLILLFCEILYSVGPEKISSRKIVDLAESDIPYICQILATVDKEEEESLLAKKIKKREQSFRKRKDKAKKPKPQQKQ